MKSIIASLLLCSFVFVASAQNEDEKLAKNSCELCPEVGDFGVSLLLGGLIDNIKLETPTVKLGQNILFARYYLKNDLVLRGGFGFDLRNYKQETADSVNLTLVTADSLSRRFTLNLSAGIEKHLKSTNRLDPYLFAQLNLTFVGKERTEINGAVQSSGGRTTIERVIKEDGGIGIGVVAGGGLNYFIAKRFSIGTELGMVFQYSSIGGTISDNTITTPANGNSISDFNTSEDLINQFDIEVEPNAVLNISYFF